MSIYIYAVIDLTLWQPVFTPAASIWLNRRIEQKSYVKMKFGHMTMESTFTPNLDFKTSPCKG